MQPLDVVDRIRDKLADLTRRVRTLERVTVADRDDQGRTAVSVQPVTVGVTEVALDWGRPLPHDQYHVTVTLSCLAGGVDTLSAALKAGSKTPTGCVVLLANTGAGPVGLAVIDVLVRV